MAVEIIDTLKPKNNGIFPVVEAEDVAVSDSLRLPEALGQKAEQTDLEELSDELAAKASTSDLTTATANLQGQINQIEISATAEAVVAPEVAAARVGDDGTEYSTLKSRLDTEGTAQNAAIEGVSNTATYVADNLSLKQGNLFDGTTTDGKLINKNGEIVDSANYCYSDYIPVTKGVKYTISKALSSPGGFYNAEKGYVSNPFSIAAATDNYEYVPTASGYVRLNITLAQKSSFYFIFGTDVANVKPHGTLTNENLVIGKTQVSGLSNDLNSIGNDIEYLSDNLCLKEGDLFNKDAGTDGYIILNDGSIIENSSYGYTDYIPVIAGSTYTIKRAYTSPGGFYDSNKQYVGRPYIVDAQQQDYEYIPSQSGYVRLNYLVPQKDNYYVVKGSYTDTIYPYGTLFNEKLIINKSQVVGGELDGINLVVFGDSRTWYDGREYSDSTKEEYRGDVCVGFQQTIARLTGATITSQGVSGNTSAQICERILQYDFTDFDAVLLEGGVNDFIKSSSVTIGEIQPIGSDFDTSTAYGAWQSAVEYLMTNYPKLKIYVDTPAVAWKGSNDAILPYNIAKIKKDVAELYSLPCKDVYNELGITTINRDNFYCDDPELTNNWHLHFNDDGNAKLGEILAKFILAN